MMRPLIPLCLAGVALRLTILALPPALPAIDAEFALRGVDVGALAAIPPLFFALAALPGAFLIARFGATECLLLGLVLNATGGAARGFAGDVLQLETATALMCLGVAIMQPAMPTLVRNWTPTRIGLATATYTFGLLVGEVIPILWPYAPSVPMVAEGWRSALFQWSLPVVATALAVALLQPRRNVGEPPTRRRVTPDWRNRSIWKVGLLLGAVNSSYFGLNGFLPGWLVQADAHHLVRPALLALNVAQIPAAMVLMVVLDRIVFRRAAYVVAGVTALVSSVGLVAAPSELSVPLAAAAGFSLAWLLTLALSLPSLIAPAEEVPNFSAAVFTVSYSLAVLTALVTGGIATAGGGRLTTILPIAVATLVIVAIGTTMHHGTGRSGS